MKPNKAMYMFSFLMLSAGILCSCTFNIKRLNSTDWPYRTEIVSSQTIYLHNTNYGIVLDKKKKELKKLFDSKKANAFQVQGSTIVKTEPSPDFMHVSLTFGGMDHDMLDKMTYENQVRMLDVKTGKVKVLAQKGGYGAEGCWSTDGSKYLYTGSHLDYIGIYDTATETIEQLSKPAAIEYGFVSYIDVNTVLIQTNLGLFQYKNNKWDILAESIGEVFRDSVGNGYFIEERQVSKITDGILHVVFTIPENSVFLRIQNNQDVISFMDNKYIVVYDLIRDKQSIYQVNEKETESPMVCISPDKDKLMMTSFGSHAFTIIYPAGSNTITFDPSPNMENHAIDWVDNDKILILNDMEVTQTRVYDLKTNSMRKFFAD